MEFKIDRPTRLVNDKGVDMGPISGGTFTMDKWEKIFNGFSYQHYAAARWIPVADISPVVVEPPPENPPPVVRQTRYSYDGGKTWTPWETWDKRQNA